MNENLQNTIAELLNKYGIAFDETKQWTIDTVMPYIKELIERMRELYIIKNSLSIFVGLIIFIFSLVVIIKTFKFCGNYKEEQRVSLLIDKTYEGYVVSDFAIKLWIILGIIMGICAIAFLFQIKALLNWIFIPEVKFIEYISTMIGV